MRFASASPHDEFPEGGLKVSGTLPYGGNSGTGIFVQDTVLLGIASAAGLASIAVNPSGAIVTGTTEPLFTATSPIAVFAQFFRKFRFRKLAMEWTSLISPGASTAAAGAGLQVQFSYENDIVTAEQTSATYNLLTATQAVHNTRFTAWANDIRCPLIDQRRIDRADELFFCSGAGDSQSAAGDAALRQTHQGAIVCVGSALNGTADLSIGTGLVHFEVDLYGFTNLASGVLPSRRRVEAKRPEVKSDAVLDEGELVDLTPRSNRLKLKPELLVETSVAPKSQSLKGTRS